MNDKSRQQNPDLPVVDLRPKPCPSCKADTEYWWSYCAMCGYHIAGGTLTSHVRQESE